MNRENAAYKLKAFLALSIILTILASVYTYAVIYDKNSFYPTVNKGRLLTNSAKLKIENAIAENNFEAPIKCRFKYAVVDLKGKVLLSTIGEYKKNTVVDLKDFLEYDKRFSMKNPHLIRYCEPIIIDNTEAGTAVFLIPKADFLKASPEYATVLETLPLIIGLIIISLLIIYLFLFIRRNVLLPLSELNKSAKGILDGDFSHNIVYDYDNEMGVFCHNFEAMRDELKYSKEREAAVKADENELLACISHDIKTPLTAIHGYVSGIKDGIVKDKAGIENYCEIILNRVKMLNKLLEDILEHSKAELNKMDIKLTEFYSQEFFDSILEDLSVEVQSKGLNFIEPKQIPNVLINADKKRITQVLYNLVSNSIKYSNIDGMISVYFENDTNYLKVYVKDTGIGIGSSDIPYIFKKFFRSEKCRNQNIPGSGLGLSISKYIVEAHGGFISCIESSDKGTIMCFSLPI